MTDSGGAPRGAAASLRAGSRWEERGPPEPSPPPRARRAAGERLRPRRRLERLGADLVALGRLRFSKHAHRVGPGRPRPLHRPDRARRHVDRQRLRPRRGRRPGLHPRGDVPEGERHRALRRPRRRRRPGDDRRAGRRDRQRPARQRPHHHRGRRRHHLRRRGQRRPRARRRRRRRPGGDGRRRAEGPRRRRRPGHVRRRQRPRRERRP
ncbi:MAG: hypothetical protein AVDCRST_MAG85-295 [uncultured Solirubrobacteraceae bacterium]|uniref:Uncharacterized protein n=1 Tax=uncultured Solirubrobacteraceae bacterium TaxID=1162706 RepID=A0A6J4RKI7_9ACTN|nr:MAG: hypothetical protein AVDCRST_MAG85-295 [uncultured Solirubrobacteraceae bacterium]